MEFLKVEWFQCDGCGDDFDSADGLEFEYTIMKPNNQYVWCPRCQAEDIPEVIIHRN